MFGIGYEGLTVDDLVSRLRLRGADVVVDVRLNALSRKKGYSKRALAEALEVAGIRYVHERRLGNPKDNRSAYSEVATSEGDGARARFRQLLEDGAAASAIQEVAELSKHHTVALLCYESAEEHCHRQQVLDAVREALTSSVAV
ncbi:DUF488 domain-containing protein [Protaetiibacter mangrovi]|uniref:DUF488 domain-containing protein n=1 Tax=Protaetiibacter mangrovi TaxID=2970926 RepID=A0ABT1ZH43_9MICO|nr:DUF488 domain-containing protein [Protaetiibacter mangrovi]MCS0500042.1 DUF488 domain-containing protein [Protaetiibacter mangrovi]